MRIFGGIVVGLLIWAFLFFVLPQEFLGGAFGRPFEIDDGQIIIRYPWGMLLMVVGFFALPYLVAQQFNESRKD
jgi:ABC-type transport system involved in multi-copper enzyme maturation permease subunit